MKLLVTYIQRSLQEEQEATLNKQFPIFSAMSIISLASLILQEPIPDLNYLLDLYAAYNAARRDNNLQKIVKTVTLLKQARQRHEPYITRALDKYKNINTTITSRPEVWHNDAVGVLRYELQD